MAAPFTPPLPPRKPPVPGSPLDLLAGGGLSATSGVGGSDRTSTGAFTVGGSKPAGGAFSTAMIAGIALFAVAAWLLLRR